LSARSRPASGPVPNRLPILRSSLSTPRSTTWPRDATTHHPAKEREDLLSAYLFSTYRDAVPVQPTPLPWAAKSKSPVKPKLIALLAHYTDAENAAAYVADASTGTQASAQIEINRATSVPTQDHAYTDFVAAEYYQGRNNRNFPRLRSRERRPGPNPPGKCIRG